MPAEPQPARLRSRRRRSLHQRVQETTKRAIRRGEKVAAADAALARAHCESLGGAAGCSGLLSRRSGVAQARDRTLDLHARRLSRHIARYGYKVDELLGEHGLGQRWPIEYRQRPGTTG